MGTLSTQQKVENLRDSARRTKDHKSVTVINGVIDDIEKASRTARELAERKGIAYSFTDADVQKIVRNAVAARRELAKTARRGGREQYAEQRELEANLIETALPKMLTTEQARELIGNIITSLEEENGSLAGDKKAIGLIMGHLKNRSDLDKREAAQIIRDILGL
jgi:YqeY-like protein